MKKQIRFFLNRISQWYGISGHLVREKVKEIRFFGKIYQWAGLGVQTLV